MCLGIHWLYYGLKYLGLDSFLIWEVKCIDYWRNVICINYIKYANPVKLLNGEKENHQYPVLLSGKWYVNVNMKKVGKEIKASFYLGERVSDHSSSLLVFVTPYLQFRFVYSYYMEYYVGNRIFFFSPFFLFSFTTWKAPFPDVFCPI